ncbi:MAG: hypothetical protein K2X24_15180 [Methylobacterium sp.]|nr:hypothetical protein [Methylobacterium sp.]
MDDASEHDGATMPCAFAVMLIAEAYSTPLFLRLLRADGPRGRPATQLPRHRHFPAPGRIARTALDVPISDDLHTNVQRIGLQD